LAGGAGQSGTPVSEAVSLGLVAVPLSDAVLVADAVAAAAVGFVAVAVPAWDCREVFNGGQEAGRVGIASGAVVQMGAGGST